jgi:D-sedoheptulose 7-phosphate isomerase
MIFNIKTHIDHHIQTATKIYYTDLVRLNIQVAAELIFTAVQSGHKLLICGNGGSAADAQHLAAEMVPMGVAALALTTDTSALTAIGNDYGFKHIFSKQVIALGQPGDVLMGISTSGKSLNVRLALAQAMLQGLHTIALTGEPGLASKAVKPTVSINVPSTNTQHIQEAHLMIEHIIWQIVKESIE